MHEPKVTTNFNEKNSKKLQKIRFGFQRTQGEDLRWSFEQIFVRLNLKTNDECLVIFFFIRRQRGKP